MTDEPVNTDSPAPSPEVPSAPGGDATPASPGAPSMPEGLDPQFWDEQTGVKVDDLAASYKELSDRVAAIGSPPENIEDYKTELPEDFNVPAGLEIKFDDEQVQGARELAKDIGLPAEHFSKLIQFEAQRMVGEYNKILAEDKAEKEKLGAQGEARISAVESFLKQHLNSELFESFRPAIYTAKQIEAVETLIKKFNSSGVPSEDGGNPPNPAPQPERMADRWYSDTTDKKAG